MYILSSLVFIPLLLLSVRGANQTIYLDDTASENITYVEAWGPGNACDQCFLKPDTSKAYQGTWHDFTYFPEKSGPAALQIQFNGVSLEVFCILPSYLAQACRLNSMVELQDRTTRRGLQASLTNTSTTSRFTMKLDTAIDNVALFDYAVVGTEGNGDNPKNLTSTPVNPSFATTATVAGPTITGSGGSRNGNNGALFNT